MGKPGRIVVVRFSDGEDVLGGIAEICRTEDIRAASFNIVGGMKGGRFVVGPESEEMPPIPVWRELQESHEAVGFGTIFKRADLDCSRSALYSIFSSSSIIQSFRNSNLH
jgi:predicted DNA-binding protein with PD1-like motif